MPVAGELDPRAHAMPKIARSHPRRNLSDFNTPISQEWVLVPLSGKSPMGKAWSSRSDPPDEDEITAWLEDDRTTGLGVLLGASGLADIDCDCVEARDLAPAMLPDTACVWGRDSNPNSHFIYRIDEAERSRRITDHNNAVLLEVRTGRNQTVVPGSLHVSSGETVEWVIEGEPSVVDYDELCDAAVSIGVGCMIARELADGAKHNLLLAFYGGLAQAGWGIDRVKLLDDALNAAGYVNICRHDQIEGTFVRDTDHKRNQAWGSVENIIDKPKMRRIKKLAMQVGNRDARNVDADDRIAVKMDGDGNLAKDVEAVLGALNDRPGVYVFGDALAHISGDRVRTHSTATLKCDISGRVSLRKYTDKNGWAGIIPPDDLVKAIHGRGDWDLPHIQGVRRTPVLRPDGSVAFAPGYDDQTQVWLTQDVQHAPAVGSSKDEAWHAFGTLLELVEETQFEEDEDRVAWVAGLITECIKPSLLSEYSVPGWFITANDRGAGKSTLAKIAICAARGVWAENSGLMGWDRGKLTLDDKKTTSAFEQQKPLLIDNVVGTIRDERLASILTDGHYAGRPLYGKDIVRYPLTGTIWITTNGGSIDPDFVRRLVPVKLLVRSGRGSDQKWSANIQEKTLNTWQQLHCHALTIMCAYLKAGAPDQNIEWFDHQNWADLVLGALAWLGDEVPRLEGRQHEMVAFDEQGDESDIFMDAFCKYLRKTGQRHVDQRDLVQGSEFPDESKPIGRFQKTMRELMGVRGDMPYTAKRLNMFMRDHSSVIDGKRVKMVRPKNRTRWGVVKAKTDRWLFGSDDTDG